MAIEIVVPTVGESITEVEIGAWLKAPGEFIQQDEPIVEIESDKATVEVFAPVAGTITEVLKHTGDVATIGELIGRMEASEAPADSTPAAAPVAAEVAQAPSSKPTAPPTPALPKGDGQPAHVMPAARRALAEAGLVMEQVQATGPGGRLLKSDVQAHQPSAPPKPPATNGAEGREEEVVRMTPMRRTISAALVQAQQTAALLTTFNEADMSGVMALRAQYKDTYKEKYGVKLGFMSFFVKACIEALKETPGVNAEVRGEEIAYRNYYDIGIAVSGKKGLVVPALRNAERMSFAEIESSIGDFARRARDNKITIDELKGGTFTITNGGVFGSLLSTPIINPPQSGILGMHSIQERPVARDGEVVIRPMMYLALTYDHRVVDGREAVTFLVRVKECIENPTRILLEI